MVNGKDLEFIIEKDKKHINNAIERVDFILNLPSVAIEKISASSSSTDEPAKLYNTIGLFATLRCLKFIGESLDANASYSEKISLELQQKNALLPWAMVVELRNNLTHHYPFLFHKNKELIFNSIFEDISDLKKLKTHLKNVFPVETTLYSSSVEENIKIDEFLYFQKTRKFLFDDPKLKPYNLNIFDFLSMADLEIGNLANVFEATNSFSAGGVSGAKTINGNKFVNSIHVENKAPVYAIENCIENIIQIIKDIICDQTALNSDIPKNKITKINLALRTEVIKSNDTALILFFTNITETRKKIAHASEKPIELKEVLEVANYLLALQPILMRAPQFFKSFQILLKGESKWDWTGIKQEPYEPYSIDGGAALSSSSTVSILHQFLSASEDESFQQKEKKQKLKESSNEEFDNKKLFSGSENKPQPPT